ncbi:beta-lactamase-like protein, partial [Abortiporus biennis]
LPPPSSSSQPYCDVYVLHGGNIEIPSTLVLAKSDGGREDEPLLIPCLSFLLVHSKSQKTLLFDLGVSENWKECYPPAVQKLMKIAPFRVDVAPGRDVNATLGTKKIDEIDYICLSHFHWDHVGDTKPFIDNRRSVFVVGKETLELVERGYPKNQEAYVSGELLPFSPSNERILALSPTGANGNPQEWAPIGPFPYALDFFKDGSLYIVDAPGHCPGHINVLARTSSDGGWVYLGGDSAHSRKLILRESPDKVEVPVDWRLGCVHMDKEASEDTMRRIREVWGLPRVRVMIAHDTEWYEENKD